MSADEADAMARLRIAAEFGLFKIDDQSLATEIILRRPFWSQAANKFIYDDVKAVPLIEMAVAGDHAADALLREFAAELLSEGLEPNLANYIRNQLLAERKQPDKRSGRMANRDAWIYGLVHAARRLGFNPMRNSATTERASACSIVAALLTEMGMPIAEKSVERIWEQQRPH